ncbi:MAG: N-carbamoylputrescine amidase [Rhodospirillales bacterium]|jgi:N-carbamoylputrescine amidase|nr:N-carbamoylputrescine amidase [Rhodospirillales bacterium]MBT4628033.1 N-carbamoylputrescine amidase [Rhodospirillales bacterium]MBT5520863.1 N-carbamoylputrescine amidase [Rhodospirillales bacterium]MBT6110340.1 N-carbamoylputrescine amidase [Rhodospirillales bacterium]MBT6825042.1 N-carbamoylputrescine amidase [Rhodospirillales bacterium]
MTSLTIAATQMACLADTEANIENAEKLVRQAAGQGAQLILLQELFQNQYFCQIEDPAYFKLAKPFEANSAIEHFKALARELKVVLPIGFFEKSNNAYFNSVAIIDADGKCLGLYRKSHIPHAPGYQEKYYFSPGDTGFRVWDTAVGRIGCGICWDQWFPECARSMALQGADVLLYPTAIGSELNGRDVGSSRKWQRVMQGHAAANCVIVAASNRIGREEFGDTHLSFYGSSFIANHEGELTVEASHDEETVITATFDMDQVREQRDEWSYFRDRRPDLYAELQSLDAATCHTSQALHQNQ